MRVFTRHAWNFGGGENLLMLEICPETIRSHTEHGHVLLAVQVPVAPVGPVAVQSGVLLVVVGRLGAKGVNHANVAPGTTETGWAKIRSEDVSEICETKEREQNCLR